MEPKKSPIVDIERRKGMYFVLGLLISLSTVLVAFEYKKYEFTISTLGNLDVVLEEEELIPITRQDKPPPPPPPPPVVQQLEIVEDEEEIEEVEIKSTDIDENTNIEIVEVEEEPVEAAPQIFQVVEEMPSFPGGEEEMFKYLGKTVVYPPMAKDAGISGTVYVRFVVTSDGSIKDAQVVRGIGGGCDDEALRVVKSMPRWKPGKQRGKPVFVQFNLPIRFVLR